MKIAVAEHEGRWRILLRSSNIWTTTNMSYDFDIADAISMENKNWKYIGQEIIPSSNKREASNIMGYPVEKHQLNVMIYKFKYIGEEALENLGEYLQKIGLRYKEMILEY